ncbi:hypothetical protein [Candidatus Poriferisodalis sp.]|uniref:hypothetical protein n=1 Tax=Candidatus Poriferisodalis sp. TaxID=3101277 RepID=UPI003D0F3999
MRSAWTVCLRPGFVGRPEADHFVADDQHPSAVILLIADLDIRVVNHDTGELIRALNPDRDNQPQPKT